MPGLHHTEVSPVQGRELRFTQALDDGKHRGIDKADVEVRVLTHDLHHGYVVGSKEGFNAI